MADIQRVRFNEPSLIRTTEPESQPVEANETPPVKRLDGEVVRLGEIAFSGGTYCEIWAGRWKKPGDKEADGEKVSLSPITSTLLMWLFAGGLESVSIAQVFREDAQGLTFADCLYPTCSCLLPSSLETRT